MSTTDYVIERPAENKNPFTAIVVVFIVALVILSVLTLVFWAAGGSFTGQPQNPATISCDSKTSNLTDITKQPTCTGTNQKYLSTDQLLVGPAPVPYQTVCRQFCPGDGNYNTVNDSCYGLTSGSSDEVQFNNCISKLKPTNCTGASLPIATSGGILYYGQDRSLTGC